jgi:hypothetical protein
MNKGDAWPYAVSISSEGAWIDIGILIGMVFLTVVSIAMFVRMHSNLLPHSNLFPHSNLLPFLLESVLCQVLSLSSACEQCMHMHASVYAAACMLADLTLNSANAAACMLADLTLNSATAP